MTGGGGEAVGIRGNENLVRNDADREMALLDQKREREASGPWPAML